MNTPEITVQQLEALRQSKADFFLLDVRNPDEFAFCNLGGYLLPFNELPQRLHELDPEAHIVIHCHTGGRSQRATHFLLEQGFKKVFNLKGGITAWTNEIDPST